MIAWSILSTVVGVVYHATALRSAPASYALLSALKPTMRFRPELAVVLPSRTTSTLVESLELTLQRIELIIIELFELNEL